MTTFNFKRDSKLHVVVGGLRYTLDIYPDFAFSQTFNETSVQVKTLHSQFDMFEGAVITKANPANFSFTSPLMLEADMDVLLDLLISWDTTNTEAVLKTADLYFEANSEIYKLEKAVLEMGSFKISKDSILLINFSGTASKLYKYNLALPGALQTRSATRTYSLPTYLRVTIGGALQSYISSVTIELKNTVQWFEFANLQNSLAISDASGTMYPGAFTVSNRVLSGTIQQYITDDNNSNVNTWSVNSSIDIKVGNLGSNPTIEFNLPSVVFTNRIDTQDLYMQGYDFRLNSNPTGSIIIKTSI
jgi:hypothetical protein